jgi:methylase of polypeptide subunit release factors
MLTESVRALPLYPEAEVGDLCTGSGVVAIGSRSG